MSNNTITTTDAVTGSERQLVLNETIEPGEEFQLLGRTIIFVTTRAWLDPLGNLLVSGDSKCKRYRTTARVCDTAKPLA